jgi:hypothetical protein
MANCKRAGSRLSAVWTRRGGSRHSVVREPAPVAGAAKAGRTHEQGLVAHRG